jgi:hypothetical protein
MVQIKTLIDVVRHEVYLYHSPMVIGGISGYFFDETQQLYGVLTRSDKSPAEVWYTVVMAQVKDDKVIILTDRTDRPLYEALMINGGLRRDQIVLAYAGETLEQPTEQG